MSADDKTIVETVGGHAFVDPFPPVVILANQLRKGAGLKTGQVVATGSFSGFFPVEVGQQIVADFEGVGKAAAMFVINLSDRDRPAALGRFRDRLEHSTPCST